MIIDEFHMCVEFYRRGLFDMIEFYDHFQQSTFKFHKKQIQALEKFNDNTTQSIGYGGSARGGKSALICLASLFECYAYPESRYLMGRKDLQLFYGTTFKTLERALSNFNFGPSDYTKRTQKNEIIFYEPKSEIVIKNLELKPKDEDATAFGSLEISKALLDQTENINEKIIEKVNERVGSYGTVKYNRMGKTMEVFNPAKTHVNKRYYQPYVKKSLAPSIAFIPALPTDNPSPEAKKWLKEKILAYQNGLMSEKEYQKQIKGNFDFADDDTQIIKYDAILDYFNGQHVKGSEKDEMYLTIDPARLGDDKTVYRVWKGWRVIARYQLLKAKINEVVNKARLIQKKHGITNSNTVVDANGLGGGVADYLGCKEFINNARMIGHEGNYASLKDQCSILMARKIQNREITEICYDEKVKEETKEEMEQVRIKDLDADGKEAITPKKQVKANIRRSPDEWDSIMMRYIFILEPPMLII